MNEAVNCQRRGCCRSEIVTGVVSRVQDMCATSCCVGSQSRCTLPWVLHLVFFLHTSSYKVSALNSTTRTNCPPFCKFPGLSRTSNLHSVTLNISCAAVWVHLCSHVPIEFSIAELISDAQNITHRFCMLFLMHPTTGTVLRGTTANYPASRSTSRDPP